MERELHILMLEDNPADAELVTYALRKGGLSFISKRVEAEEDFCRELADFQPDVILLDYELPTFDGSSALIIARNTAPDTPAIFVTGIMGEESAIDMLHQGATDYVLKDNLSRLVPAVNRALSEVEETSKRRAAEEAFRKSEEALRQSEAFYHALLEHTMDCITMLDGNGIIVYESPSITQLLGYDQDELVGKSVFEYIHPEDIPAAVEAFSEGKQTPLGSSAEMEVRFRHKDRSWRNLWGTGRNLLDDPAVHGVILNSRDITDRKSVEDDLRKTQFTVDHSADSMFWLTAEGKIVYANEEACRRRGYTREEMLSLTIFDVNVDFAADPGSFEMMSKRLRESGRFTSEFRHRTRDGEVFPVEVSLNRFEFEGDEIFVANIRDITERKQAEEALRESEKRVMRKLNAILEPEGDIDALELFDIIESAAIQSLMEDFYQLTNIGVAVSDRSATILVATGWQDICTRFHRVHPETRQHCIESDLELSEGVDFGTFKLYRCKNNMWDMSTPIVVAGNHIGNLYLGQFLFEDETPDYELFRRQARLYGFDEREYLSALERVPRWSRETVDTVMAFYTKLTGLVSSLGHSKVALARALAEKDKLLAELREGSQDVRRGDNGI